MDFHPSSSCTTHFIPLLLEKSQWPRNGTTGILWVLPLRNDDFPNRIFPQNPRHKIVLPRTIPQEMRTHNHFQGLHFSWRLQYPKVQIGTALPAILDFGCHAHWFYTFAVSSSALSLCRTLILFFLHASSLYLLVSCFSFVCSLLCSDV